MKTVFVSGSRSISDLPIQAMESLDRMVEKGMQIVVGDCWGVDRLVQQYLASKHYASHVTVYTIGKEPRNFVDSGFNTRRVIGTSQAAKDEAMAKIADYALAIWDGKSRGTAKNIERMAGKVKVIQAQPAKTETIAVNKFGPVHTCKRCLNTRFNLTFGTPCPTDPHVVCGMSACKKEFRS